MLLTVSRRTIVTALLIASSSSIVSAQDPMRTMGEMLTPVESKIITDGSPETPASMTNPSGILPLATGGPFIFDPLPMRGSGCNPRPILSYTGPDFCGCTKRIYYGTDPCDDDPVLTMSPTITDAKTTHWYQHAFRMVTRKKAVAEAIK